MESHTVMTHRVDESEDGKMVRQVLRNRFRFSRRQFRRLKVTDGVRVNGSFAYLTSRVKTGDVITVTLTDEEPVHIPPQPVPLHIMYEDEDLLVLDKQPGVVVHPTKDYRDWTLANGLVHHWRERGETHQVRPVTRLDKETSGLIVFAKHAHAHAFLSGQMANKRYKREYLAIVHGRVLRTSGTIDAPIGRDPAHTSRRIVTPDGAEAVTHYRVEAAFSKASLVRLSLETGRTHQIRVHLAHLGHPIIGDTLYGNEEDAAMWGMERQALHAARLTLIHPRDKSSRTWESPIPADMKRLLDRVKQAENK
ncbi:RluA family pseudouridine synthase [Polycladomyces sp. WAk]|uniref:Pseudouridine synthase n=1 Tax=Polycladomyces zharkentensis TaxID=2807616 RepID=A0ABS2WNI6_9BACL|nr:RluA family pseudouridine synthase [Polycladomyces sp. WAk]MBN2911001.1 RluA family pseudouridine synthase [Polycladomyces sp. WAk]